MNKKSQILWLKLLGAGCGSAGFILSAVGGQLNLVIGAGLIGIGTVLIAAGS